MTETSSTGVHFGKTRWPCVFVPALWIWLHGRNRWGLYGHAAVSSLKPDIGCWHICKEGPDQRPRVNKNNNINNCKCPEHLCTFDDWWFTAILTALLPAQRCNQISGRKAWNRRRPRTPWSLHQCVGPKLVCSKMAMLMRKWWYMMIIKLENDDKTTGL